MLDSVILSSSSVSGSAAKHNQIQHQESGRSNPEPQTNVNSNEGVISDTPVVANGTNQLPSMINHSSPQYTSHLPGNMESASVQASNAASAAQAALPADSRTPPVRKGDRDAKSHTDSSIRKKSDKPQKKTATSSAKLDTPSNTPDSKRKADKPSKKALKLGTGSTSKKETASDNEGVTGCTLMSPDNAPSLGCFGCISRKGRTFPFPRELTLKVKGSVTAFYPSSATEK